MKAKICTFIAAVFCFSFIFISTVAAQEAFTPSQEELELSREVQELKRKAIVVKTLQLSTEEDRNFWSLYKDYRSAMGKINEAKYEMIKSFADSFNKKSLDDQQASKLLDRFLFLEKRRLMVWSSYVPKFKQILPAKKTVRFFQIENKMDAIIGFAMAGQIPLVGDEEMLQEEKMLLKGNAP